MNSKRVYKYNSGIGAVLCSNCYTILKEGSDITPEERLDLKLKTKLLKGIVCSSCRKSLISEYKKELNSDEKIDFQTENQIIENIIKNKI